MLLQAGAHCSVYLWGRGCGGSRDARPASGACVGATLGLTCGAGTSGAPGCCPLLCVGRVRGAACRRDSQVAACPRWLACGADWPGEEQSVDTTCVWRLLKAHASLVASCTLQHSLSLPSLHMFWKWPAQVIVQPVLIAVLIALVFISVICGFCR